MTLWVSLGEGMLKVVKMMIDLDDHFWIKYIQIIYGLNKR